MTEAKVFFCSLYEVLVRIVAMVRGEPVPLVTPPAVVIDARAAVPPIYWQAEGIEGAAVWVDARELLMKDADAPLPG